MNITIARDENNPAQMRVTIPDMKYGTVEFTIGSGKAEFVQAEGDFTYRGRKYSGKLLLLRKTFTPAPGYRWMLKRNEQHGENAHATASWSVYNAISEEVTKAILATLRAHPEILSQAEHASLAAELARAEAKAQALYMELAKARQHADELRAELGAGSHEQHL